MAEMTARNVSIWVLVIGILVSLVVYFSLVGRMYLTTQKERDWQRDRLEGQRCYVSGDYQKAEKAYEAALEDLSGYKGSSLENQAATLANTLNESGRIDALLNRKGESEEKYSKARSIYQRLLDSSGGDKTKPESTNRAMPGLIRSISGLANLNESGGRMAEAEKQYSELYPLYVRWWQSQSSEVYQPDPQHKKSNSGERENAVVSGADTSMSIQLVNDLTIYGTLCLANHKRADAREVASLLMDVCQKAPIDTALKKKADLVYRLAFNHDKNNMDKDQSADLAPQQK